MLDAFDSGADSDSDLPPWAGPGVETVRAVRRRPAAVVELANEPPPVVEPEQDRPPRRIRKPGRSRAAATRRRRSRRRLLTLLAAAVVIAVVVVAVHYLSQPKVAPSGPITTLQKGEYASVPDACRAIPAAALAQYLGASAKSIRPQPGQCTLTVDAKPRFRELTVIIQALMPNAGYGNGSATADANYNFVHQRAVMAKPPRHTPAPPATITPIAGLGNQAFVAVQVFRVGVTTNEVTVLVRYRNVLITTLLQGEVSNGFGPAPVSQLQAGALEVARAVLRTVVSSPAVG